MTTSLPCLESLPGNMDSVFDGGRVATSGKSRHLPGCSIQTIFSAICRHRDLSEAVVLKYTPRSLEP